MSAEHSPELRVIRRHVKAPPVFFDACEREQPVAGDATIKSADEREPPVCDAFSHPGNRLRRLPSEPFQTNQDETTAVPLEQQKCGIGQWLLAQHVMQRRLESRDTVEDRHVMRRGTQQVEIQHIEAIDRQLDQRAGVRLRQPSVDR